jgi:hypothetical protein
MSPKLPLLASMVLVPLLVALAACGDDNETTPTEEGTGTPTATTETTPAATAAPTTPGASGTATATVVVGGQTLQFQGGRCDKADDESWLVVSIGEPTGPEHFELLVGTHPGAGPDVKPATGGGEFTEGILVTAVQGDNTFTMAPAEGNEITLAPDIQSGEFSGKTIQSQQISGSFHC